MIGAVDHERPRKRTKTKRHAFFAVISLTTWSDYLLLFQNIVLYRGARTYAKGPYGPTKVGRGAKAGSCELSLKRLDEAGLPSKWGWEARYLILGKGLMKFGAAFGSSKTVVGFASPERAACLTGRNMAYWVERECISAVVV